MKPWVVLIALLLAACSRPTPPGVTELVYATPYPPSHPFSKADQAWIKFVEARSGGHLRIRTNWSGALLSSDMSMEELRHGVADIGLITPIYVRGGVHLIRTQTGFYSGADSVESQVTLYRCMQALHPEFDVELRGLKILAVQGGSLPGLATTDRQVRTLNDLKGLRLRAPTELLPVLAALGADPVNMPMGDVYSAMSKGIIDGVIAPGDTFKALHFAEVAHYFNTLSTPRGAYPARAMRQARWNSLSPEDRRILEESTSVWEAALAREVRAALQVGFAEARARGVVITQRSAADQAQFDALYLHFAERSAAELSGFGIDGLSAFRTARASIVGRDQVQCRRGA